MRIKKLIVGAALTGAAVLSACGPAPQARPAADTGTPSPTTTTTTTTTPTTTTTTPPPAPPAAEPAPAPAPAPAPKPKPTTTKPKPKPAPKPAGGTPCTITDGACIDLSANRSWLLKGGVVSYGPVPITHGRPGYRTPPGTFRVSFKDIDHKSSIFDNAPMPYSVFFNGGIAFHAGSLRELSHGCIHLSNGAAKTYYNSLAVGATVQVVR